MSAGWKGQQAVPARWRLWRDRALEEGLRATAYAVFGLVVLIIGFIGVRGMAVVGSGSFPFIDWEFLTGTPESLYSFEHGGRQHLASKAELEGYLAEHGLALEAVPVRILSYAGGGIFPAIAGSFILVAGALVLALGLGISAAVYLSEYSRESRLLRVIRLAILNLASVPSIIYGLFGLGLFVLFFGWGQSLLAGWLTLAILALPLVIRASEDALRAVPTDLREASLALGATRWQTIYHNVLPQALSGILTASVLSVVRVAGETAPILFTVALAYRANAPWEVDGLMEFMGQGVMALPYHLYIVATRLPVGPESARAQFGTALIFMLFIVAMTSLALYLRARVRRNLMSDN